MSGSLTHARVATTAADGSDINTTHWNANHTASGPGLVGRSTAGAGPVELVSVGPGLELSGGALATNGTPTPSLALQPAFFGDAMVHYAFANGTTTLAVMGAAVTATGTNVAVTTMSATSFMTRIVPRLNYATAATVAAQAGFRHNGAYFWRGDAAGRGGFFAHWRVTTDANTRADGQFFVGLSSSTGALAGDPSTDRPDAIGLAKDVADANWQLIRRTGTGTAVKTNTGLAVGNNQVLDLWLWCQPNSDRITARLVLRDWAADTVLADNVEWTTAIPAATTALCAQHQGRASVASVTTLGIVRMYAERRF